MENFTQENTKPLRTSHRASEGHIQGRTSMEERWLKGQDTLDTNELTRLSRAYRKANKAYTVIGYAVVFASLLAIIAGIVLRIYSVSGSAIKVSKEIYYLLIIGGLIFSCVGFVLVNIVDDRCIELEKGNFEYILGKVTDKSSHNESQKDMKMYVYVNNIKGEILIPKDFTNVQTGIPYYLISFRDRYYSLNKSELD
jgi:hypothetical protein